MLLDDLLLTDFELKVQSLIAARAKAKELHFLRGHGLVKGCYDVGTVPQVPEVRVRRAGFQDLLDCTPLLILSLHLVQVLGTKHFDVIDEFLVAGVRLCHPGIPIPVRWHTIFGDSI